MVCKINFDYEMLLSDNNDSITSSELSSDDECFNKKFSLGDNILDPNPLKIISVRQLNNFPQTHPNESLDVDCQAGDESNCKTIPMNNYLCYDESISDFEAESISECEFDSFFDSEIIDRSDLKNSNLSLTYELPIVNRFQVLPDINKTDRQFPSIDEVNRYCINEKLKRLQKADKIQEPIQDLNPTKISQESQYDADQASQIKSNAESFDQSTLSSEILSNLPIDLLTEFINGEKSEKEVLNQITKKSNKKRKKGKKSKRHKVESVKNNLPQKLSKTKSTLEVADNIKSQKNIPSKNNTAITDLPNCSLSDNQQIISYEASITRKLSNVDNKDILSEGNLLKEIINTESSKKSNFTDFPPHSDEASSLDSFSHSSAFNYIDNSQTDENYSSTINEKQKPENNFLRNCSLQNSYKISEKSISENILSPIENSTGNTENDIPTEISLKPDESKDTRTSSTDSGFHEIENDDSNDYKNQIEKSNNEIQINENSHMEFINDIKLITETTKKDYENYSNITQYVPEFIDRKSVSMESVSQHLDLSSFKFKFINESNLNKENNTPINNNVNSLSNTDTRCKNRPKINFINNQFKKSDLSEINSNANNHHQHKNSGNFNEQSNLTTNTHNNATHTQNCDSISCNDTNSLINTDTISTGRELNDFQNNGKHRQQTNFTNNQSEKSDLEINSNANNQQINSESLNKSFTNQSNQSTINAHNITRYTQYSDSISSIEKYNPFRVNYYSPEYTISNKEEISLFLYFQWLKFCEQCTKDNHNL